MNFALLTAALVICTVSGLEDGNGPRWPIIRTTYFDAYEHDHHQGQRVELDADSSYLGKHCHDMPGGWNDRVSSIHTRGGCILVFSDGDCKGRSLTLQPGTPHHTDLAALDFNDVMSSYKRC